MLRPYHGRMRKFRFESPGKGARRVVDTSDGSKSITYSFNSLGFRGEEFDPDSPVKLFVSGCSFTFGVGVEYEESWPFLFKQRLAEWNGLPASSVNLMNFADGGASNDYTTRTLIEQSVHVRPDVIVAGFTHMDRFELLDETTTNPFKMGGHERMAEALGELGKLGQFRLLGQDEVEEKMRMIKNVLMLQYFCRSRDIPYVFFFFESLERPDLPSALSLEITQPLFDEIDFESFIPIDQSIRVDLSFHGSGYHPGPRTQELLADAAWRTFRTRYRSSSLLGAGAQ